MSFAARFRLILLALSILGGRTAASAQGLTLSVPYRVDGVTYDGAVSTPEAVLGYRIGDRHTRPHELVEYFKVVSSESDRVALVEYGRTYEGRPLVAAIVTSPANQARLQDIKASNLRLSDDPASLDDAEIEAMPVVAELHYTVHGNEASGSEAAMLLLYHLAAGSGESVQSVLDHAVVVIDPCINPDGRDRFVDWVNGNRSRGGNVDPQDREHNEPWPEGRTNHYWFDLNRDWLPAQLQETHGRLELFHSWRPQVLLDVHEMGSDQTFFFQPGVPERTNPNTPAANQELTGRLTRYTGRALDRIGSLYFSREQYDDFYYGKGSTYPDVNGAIGILFEQGSSRALVRSTADGELSLAFAVRNQLAASLGLLEGAIALRVELLQNQRTFYASAIDESRAQPVRGWIFGTEQDRTRSDALVRMLRRHRVQVYALARRTTVDGTVFSPGASYVVPAEQAQFRLIKSAFERVLAFRDSVFYDVSTWTLPLAFGVAHAQMTSDVSQFLGQPIEEHVSTGGRLLGGQSDYGYVIGWESYYAPRLLYRLLAAGASARVALKPFELMIAGQRAQFRRGSIIVQVHNRSGGVAIAADSLFRLISDGVMHDHVVAYSVGRSQTLDGPDLGGPSTVPLHVPKVAALSGEGVSAYRLGELRFLLNERMGMPVTLLDKDRLEKAVLKRYTAIVMVDGKYDDLPSAFVDGLRAWVNEGGRLITVQRAAKWAVEQGLSAAEFESSDRPDTQPWIRFEDMETAKESMEISGAILDVQLDASHPIAFGLNQRIASFKMSRDVLKPSVEPGSTVGVYTHDPILSGYVPHDRKSAFAGKAALLSLKSGEGRVVLMEDTPTFRGFWYGTQRLILNALFLAEAY